MSFMYTSKLLVYFYNNSRNKIETEIESLSLSKRGLG